MSDTLEHQITMRFGGKTVTGWDDYDIPLDILEPWAPWSMKLPKAGKDAFDIARPDHLVEILVDGTRVLTGYVDDRDFACGRSGGSTLHVVGRGKVGRLVDESMPFPLSFENLGIRQLAEKVAKPWFDGVTLSNATNRRLMLGTDDDGNPIPIAGASSEPAIDESTKKRHHRVEPGESRWHVLDMFTREGQLLAWATADGKQLIVGRPNYAQAPQYRFFLPKPGSDRQVEGNVNDVHLKDSVGERYSKLFLFGAVDLDDEDADGDVIHYTSTVVNGPYVDGTGNDFLYPKRLTVKDRDAHSQQAANEHAKREMAFRDATGRRLVVSVRGHGQIIGGRKVLFAPDTMATVELEQLEILAPFLITSVHMRRSRGAGTSSVIHMVPKGTVLRQ